MILPFGNVGNTSARDRPTRGGYYFAGAGGEMKIVAKGEYWYVAEGRKYWNVWRGNPFCIGLFRIPKTAPLEDLKKTLEEASKVEKERFTKKFPDVPWKGDANA